MTVLTPRKNYQLCAQFVAHCNEHVRTRHFFTQRFGSGVVRVTIDTIDRERHHIEAAQLAAAAAMGLLRDHPNPFSGTLVRSDLLPGAPEN